jgi:methionyl-tRNA synthetase
MSRKLLVTAALPYANGHIHIGHLVEYTQTDIWVRFQRSRGRRAIYICADDTHGTAIMMRARQENRAEDALIAEMSDAHQQDFAAFDIVFDHFGSTNSKANLEVCTDIWGKLRGAGLVAEREVTQLFDPKEGVFLADRFVKGTCPKCGATDQYGDNCEKCSSTYSAVDLKDPVSTLSGTRPEVRGAPHLFVTIEEKRPFLLGWTQAEGKLQPAIATYLKNFFLGEPLRDWDVSRPAPYFGFEIPDAPGHYWYVWFDAPIGYIASTREWCEKTGESLDDWWRTGAGSASDFASRSEIVHVIGKDITYFHALFWPAVLDAARYQLPDRVQVHGFLTVNGEKMSKSKGTFILASTYREHLDPSALRYFFACKLGPKVDDIDLSFEEFVARVSSELVNKVVNLASRSARFVKESGLSPVYPDDGGLFSQGAAAGEEIAKAYADWDFARATRLAMGLADRANEYLDRAAPWTRKKEGGKDAEVRDICTIALNLFRQIMIYLAPVVPRIARDAEALLGVSLGSWADAATPLVGVPIAEYKHLMQRIDPAAVAKVVEASAAAPPAGAAPVQKTLSSEPYPATMAKTLTSGGTDPTTGAAVPTLGDDAAALTGEPLAAECSIDDFQKVDLRVARIVAAEHVPEAKKLIKLTVSLGGDVRRTIFAGIKAHHAPESLVGRLCVVVANLAPRKMKLGTSEGMVVAASGEGTEGVFLLAPDEGAKPGMRVH